MSGLTNAERTYLKIALALYRSADGGNVASQCLVSCIVASVRPEGVSLEEIATTSRATEAEIDERFRRSQASGLN